MIGDGRLAVLGLPLLAGLAMPAGAALATGNRAAVLLAGLSTLQNLPEGFYACRELRASTGLSGAPPPGAVAGFLLGPGADRLTGE